MKILYYLPSLYAPGGLERIITFKANYLADHFDDYEVYILTSEQVGMEPYFPISPRVKHIDIDVPFDWPFEQSGISKVIKYPAQYRLFKERFSDMLYQIRPDLTVSTLRRELNFIHSLDDGSVKIGEFHATRNAYGVGYRNNGNPLLYMMRRRWEKNFRRNVQKFRRLVLLTKNEAGYWPELDNLEVIPNPITIPIDQLSDCTRRQVIAVGRYDYAKGFDRLIEAWSIVARRYSNWTLRIHGDGALRSMYESQIERLGLQGSCLLEPTVPNIVPHYAQSSILAVPSRYEGFGMVITEAMACGLPVVAFDCPCGPGNIITNQEDGLLVENGDIPAFAESLCYLMECDGIRQQMGQKAALNSRRFQPDTILSQWDKLFKQLAGT